MELHQVTSERQLQRALRVEIAGPRSALIDGCPTEFEFPVVDTDFEADFSRTNLARGRETDVVNRCQTVLNLGTENAEALAVPKPKAVKTAKGAKSALRAKKTARNGARAH